MGSQWGWGPGEVGVSVSLGPSCAWVAPSSPRGANLSRVLQSAGGFWGPGGLSLSLGGFGSPLGGALWLGSLHPDLYLESFLGNPPGRCRAAAQLRSSPSAASPFGELRHPGMHPGCTLCPRDPPLPPSQPPPRGCSHGWAQPAVRSLRHPPVGLEGNCQSAPNPGDIWAAVTMDGSRTPPRPPPSTVTCWGRSPGSSRCQQPPPRASQHVGRGPSGAWPGVPPPGRVAPRGCHRRVPPSPCPGSEEERGGVRRKAQGGVGPPRFTLRPASVSPLGLGAARSGAKSHRCEELGGALPAPQPPPPVPPFLFLSFQ